jgi:transcriptional regulator with XRE-family HTH domain
VEAGTLFATADEVGAFLRSCRERSGMSQKDLAAALEDDPRKVENKRTQISNWENGRFEPGGGTVLAILKITGSLADPEPGELLAARLASFEEQTRRLLDVLANFSPR